MLYNPPTGSTDPDAPYVGKNIGAGTQGSKVPPKAIENTQREIVAAITAAGLTPTNGELDQLWKAIRASGYRGITLLDTGTPNAVVVSPVPAITARALGQSFRVKIGAGNTNTAGATFNAGPGGAALKNNDGSPILPGQLLAGGIYDIVDDGTYYQILTPPGYHPVASSRMWTVGATGSLNVPASVFLMYAEGWAPGGPGGAGNGSSGGGGGGGGAYGRGFYAVAPGQVISVTVGAPGTPPTTSGATGGAGGTSSLGSYLTLTGGQPGAGSAAGGAGGAGGTASGAGFSVTGNSGQSASGAFGGQGGGAFCSIGGWSAGTFGNPGQGLGSGGGGASTTSAGNGQAAGGVFTGLWFGA